MIGSASMPHEIGPRAKISAFIAAAPLSVPYSEMVAFGYLAIATHVPPIDEKVLHVRAMFCGVQLQSAAGQRPSSDSDEHAMYLPRRKAERAQREGGRGGGGRGGVRAAGSGHDTTAIAEAVPYTHLTLPTKRKV